jgi:hypothetical protein
MKRSFALVAATLASIAAFGQNVPTTNYLQGTLPEMLCGNQGMPPTSVEIPTIGCFSVASGGNARGMFDEHQFVVAVDTLGEALCHLDGVVAGCTGCVGQDVPECPVRLVIVSRNADKSVSFSVQRKADGNRYLFRVDAWNRYLELKQTHQELAAAEVRPERSALPPGASPVPPTLPQSSAPALPPGMYPFSVAADGPAALNSVGWRAQSAYGGGQFAKFDQLIETLSQPDQLTDDGMPQVWGVSQGLWEFLYQWKNWQFDLDKIAEWRKEFPDSHGADFAEATLWRAWGWHARGDTYASTVTPEGWKLFGEKLARADKVLERSKAWASKSPLWYQLRLSVARDMNWDRKRYQALFDEATLRFPWYVPLYLSAANYLSPKWGGSYEEVDKLARRTTTSPFGNDNSLYTRIYWDLADQEGPEFDPFRDSHADWSLMKAGFDGLLKRYPKSKWNLNAYAYFACRANDGATYGQLRVRIGRDLIPSAWASNYSTDVCDERLLGHT